MPSWVVSGGDCWVGRRHPRRREARRARLFGSQARARCRLGRTAPVMVAELQALSGWFRTRPEGHNRKQLRRSCPANWPPTVRRSCARSGCQGSPLAAAGLPAQRRDPHLPRRREPKPTAHPYAQLRPNSPTARLRHAGRQRFGPISRAPGGAGLRAWWRNGSPVLA